ncbi:hypothetical protein AVEN_226969-1 [Araneus ventricosus]|uniref:Peptidase A2 domain-containing protein n=1 Tax=Araneus ventricosus TaxID=182803 RepID=A0A4Y2UU60_ARAVE|nr:hypothetical protein AVEN_226969-1 [Araneus ventricosus]
MPSSLQLESETTRKSGKLQFPVSSAINTAAENVYDSDKFPSFIRDRRSNLHFLLDSGADDFSCSSEVKRRHKIIHVLLMAQKSQLMV